MCKVLLGVSESGYDFGVFQTALLLTIPKWSGIKKAGCIAQALGFFMNTGS